MTVTNIGTRKIGADDVSFGRASLVYQDYLGVTRSIAQVNASQLPFYSQDAMVENLVDGSYKVNLYAGSLYTSAGPWIDAISFNNGALTSATLNAAASYLSGLSCILRISKGAWTISSDVTFDASITVRIDAGATLNVATGKTVTFNGPVWAEPVQIFSLAGTGLIKFAATTPEIYADWYVTTAGGDNTAEVLAACKSTSHLVSGGMGRRPPVIFTRAVYNIASLSLTEVSGSVSYVGISLIGRPGGGTSGSVKFAVTGAASNGIILSADTAAGVFSNYATLENISIEKDSYPADDTGDYGIKCIGVQFLNLKNVRTKNFGGAGLYLSESYMNRYDGFTADTCYRGIYSVASSWGASWGCTTQNFLNTLMYDCKRHIEVNGGRAHMTFNGYTSDINHNTTAYVLDLTSSGSSHDVQIYFEQAWFEGMSGGYVIRCGGTTTYPFYNQIGIKDSVFSSNAKNTIVTTASTGTAIITIDDCLVAGPLEVGRLVLIPNRSDIYGMTELLSIDTGGDVTPSTAIYGSTSTGTAYKTYGPNSISVVNDGVANYNGVFSHRFIDSTYLAYDKATDIFRSSIFGLWASALRLQRSGGGYGSVTRISHSAIAPTASTCTGSATAPNQYKLTNVTNASQYAAGDPIRVAGAGAGGGNLDTTITNIEWDASIFYIKDPVKTAVAGAAMTLYGAVGDIKINTAPAHLGYIGWVCTAAGYVGTWYTFGAIS